MTDVSRHPRGGPEWSLAMIVKDAEGELNGVLGDAGSLCDEIVVVDTGSVDATKSIAGAHGARVFDFEWIDDFSAARNAAFDHCTGRWILWLDADDRIPPDALAAFHRLKGELATADVDVVMVPYRIGFSGSDASVCTFSFDRERIVRRSAGPRWVGPVHEFISVEGDVMRWPAAWVEHRPPDGHGQLDDRNLRILQRAVDEGDRSSRTLFYLGNELRDLERWKEATTIYREYLSEPDTAVWEQYSAVLSLSTCAEALGRDVEKLDHLYTAVRLDSSRAEAFVRIGKHYYDRREYHLALPFFSAATALPRPEEGFIDDAAYASDPWDFLAVCHSALGMHEAALVDTMKALPTSEDRQRLLANIEYYVKELRRTNSGADGSSETQSSVHSTKMS